ncbi:XkdQ/YqbQ family protein [Priestia abyssalis]|uniref:XkdQ/YqbQ family protein n=1 Tax=Priestia abyssalis TaxID=1221450 RepID=UPI000995D28D|nr:hypothetical protein [Priestia abyssalis]
MAHELWVVKNSTMTNITPLVGSLSWRSNKDELGDEVSFNIAINDEYFPVNPCKLGDVVVLKNKEEITRCILVEENRNGRSPIQYAAFDYAFYLNKSNAIYQFNKMRADQAIKKIASDFNVPVGNVTSMPTIINKIYNSKKVSEIIKDIQTLVEQDQGQKYLMEMRRGKLFIEKQRDLIVKGSFQLPPYTIEDVTRVVSDPSRRRSIVDMKNIIQIVSGDKLITQVSNDVLVNQYGRLQEVISIDENEVSKAKNIAQNHLKNLAKVLEESSVELLGDDNFRAGRLFEIAEPTTGLKGTYLIKDVNHTVFKGIHKMTVGLEVAG